jgi:hypothetical protein
MDNRSVAPCARLQPVEAHVRAAQMSLQLAEVI